MANVVKVVLNPKKPTQTQRVYDFTTGVVTTTCQQYWIVVWDSVQKDPTRCYIAADPTSGAKIPVMGQDFATTVPGGATNSGILCNRIQPMLEPSSAGKLYHVQADFTTRPVTAGNQPAKWDITVSIDGAPVTETIYSDSNGKAIVNSAGQPFQQQDQKVYFDNVYRVGFKSRSLDVKSIDAIQGQLNQSAFTLNIASLNFSKLFEAQSTKLTRCPTSTTLTGDPTQPAYWQAEYELYYRRPQKSPIDGSPVSGWAIFKLDQGFCTLSGGNPKAILDANGNPLNSPQYLDGSGNQSSSPVFLQFAPAETSIDFSPLFAGIA